jgi:WD40 repeat protein
MIFVRIPVRAILAAARPESPGHIHVGIHPHLQLNCRDAFMPRNGIIRILLICILFLVCRSGLAADDLPPLWTGRVLPLTYEPQRRDIPVVTALAIQPHGTLLAAAGDDHDVRVWDRDTGQLVWQLKGHSDWVRSLAFSPDGEVLVSGGNDRRVIFWGVTTGKKTSELPMLTGAVTAVVFSHDGNRLAVTGFESPLVLFNPHTGEHLSTWKCPCIDMRALAFSPDDRLLASAGRNGKIRVWQIADGSVVKEYRPHRQRIRGLVFAADGERIVSCGEDRSVVIAHMDNDEITNLAQANAKILSVTLAGRWLATGCSDNTIRLWDLEQGREFAVLEGHEGSVAVLESKDDLLISGSYDTTVRSWSVTSQVSAPR